MGRQLFGWVKGALAVLGEVVRQRRFLVLWSVALVAYQLFLLAPFLVTFGAFPNYAKVYDAWGGILESIWLRPPLPELWELVTDQPVYEFGIRDRFGFTPVQFVATTHALFTMITLPPLVALSVLLQTQVWPLVQRGRGLTVASASTSTVASLLGASTSAVACCGASAGPILLTMMGFGFGTAGVIVEYAEVLELAGYVLLVGSVVGLAGWIRTCTGVTGCGPGRPLGSGTSVLRRQRGENVSNV